ncbi:uncharacterized protein LOC123306723 [Coccinella septempunctata]|uniref:uncharacterized protein LOC123306723 n=1 Tax=Coccinella septempunctata TaxID=41139 RepID=UPI001D085AB1|nr:uncharacterized protein LOC123306723 [Coccinella septempunctata]
MEERLSTGHGVIIFKMLYTQNLNALERGKMWICPSHEGLVRKMEQGFRTSGIIMRDTRYKFRLTTIPCWSPRRQRKKRRAGLPDVVILVAELCQLTGLTEEQRRNFTVDVRLATKTRIPPLSPV